MLFYQLIQPYIIKNNLNNLDIPNVTKSSKTIRNIIDNRNIIDKTTTTETCTWCIQ